jgi:hypothetical protein
MRLLPVDDILEHDGASRHRTDRAASRGFFGRRKLLPTKNE